MAKSLLADLVLEARSPFAGVLGDYGIDRAGVTVTDLDGTGIASVLALKTSGIALGETVRVEFGIDLPDGPRRVANKDTAFIGVGDGRWLAISETGGNDFAQDLGERLAGLAGVTDQSDGFGLVRLGGPDVRRTLAKGLGIDLSPEAFPIDAVAATALGHIGVTIWRREDAPEGTPVFEIALFSSMAQSFNHWLCMSAGEFGLKVVARG